MRLALSDSEDESDVSSSSGISRSQSSRRSKSASFSGEQDDDSGSASEDMPPVNRLAESDSDEDASESEEEAAPKQASLVPSSPSPSPSPEPLPKRKSLAQLSGQDVARNKIMQASLFQASQASTSGPSYLRGLPLTSKPSSSASQPLQSTSTPLGLLGDVEAPSEEESDKPDVHTAAKLPGRAPRAPTKLQRMPHNHSVVNSDAANPALRLTRSFAPAWGPDGILAGPT